MRHQSLRPLSWLAPLGFVLAVASCSDVAGPGGYVVTYRMNVTGIATIDSVYYDNGTGACTSSCNPAGTMQRVVTPNPRWAVSLTNVRPGGSMEVRVFGSGTAAGSAYLVRLWMEPDGTLQGDSIAQTTAAAGAFTATLPARQL